ncbi:MAG: hypothetical protein H7Z18_04150 [Methylophilaceae bacterium]|nr:hypothetical protein [Methylophilaceae bacterium]
MKKERGLSQKDNLGDRHSYRLLMQSWLSRKCNKIKRNKQLKVWLNTELTTYSMSLHGTRVKSNFVWQ